MAGLESVKLTILCSKGGDKAAKDETDEYAEEKGVGLGKRGRMPLLCVILMKSPDLMTYPLPC